MTVDKATDLDKLFNEYYAPIKLPDVNRDGLKAAILAREDNIIKAISHYAALPEDVLWQWVEDGVPE